MPLQGAGRGRPAGMRGQHHGDLRGGAPGGFGLLSATATASSRTSAGICPVSRASLDRWIRTYRAGGFTALVPAPRRLTRTGTPNGPGWT